MRSKLLLLALPVLFVAAHPSTPPAKPSTPPAPAPGESTMSFAKLNLAPLWKFTGDGSDDKIHNGFFGYGYRRLELVFTSVQRDQKNPAIYHVQGKNRRYNIVRSFSGAIELRDLQRVAPVGDKELADGWQFYTAKGQFTFNENARAGDAAYGSFCGDLAMDLTRDTNGRLLLNQRTTNAATRHGGFLLNGTWTDAATKAKIDVLVKNGLAVTYQVLQDFEFGGRSVEINPKYTRVGWDGYWRNDEWWAEKPVARR